MFSVTAGWNRVAEIASFVKLACKQGYLVKMLLHFHVMDIHITNARYNMGCITNTKTNTVVQSEQIHNIVISPISMLNWLRCNTLIWHQTDKLLGWQPWRDLAAATSQCVVREWKGSWWAYLDVGLSCLLLVGTCTSDAANSALIALGGLVLSILSIILYHRHYF